MMSPTNLHCLDIYSLGILDFRKAVLLQDTLVRQIRSADRPHTVFFLEHNPVITLGRGTHLENLLHPADWYKERNIAIVSTSRGGDITYHGPGQLVCYPLINLKIVRQDMHWYLRVLEDCVIQSLSKFEIPAWRVNGKTGVWTDKGKIAAIGVRAQGWVTSHGFSLNVNMDMRPFNYIVPCGLAGDKVTSMADILGSAPDRDKIEEALKHALSHSLGLPVHEKSPLEISELI